MAARVLVICDGDDKLKTTGDDESVDEENAATSVSNDDEGVCNNGNETSHAEDVAHGERIVNLGHGEEVGLVSYQDGQFCS